MYSVPSAFSQRWSRSPPFDPGSAERNARVYRLDFHFPSSGGLLSGHGDVVLHGQAQKYALRATSLAYSSVIVTRVSGPGAIALDQLIDGTTSVICALGVNFSVAGFSFMSISYSFLTATTSMLFLRSTFYYLRWTEGLFRPFMNYEIRPFVHF